MFRKVEVEEIGEKNYIVPDCTDQAAYNKKVRIFFDPETIEVVVCQGRYCDTAKVPPIVGDLDLCGIEFRANVALHGYAYGIGPNTIDDFRFLVFSGGTDLVRAYEKFDNEGKPIMLSDAVRRHLKLNDGEFTDEPYVIGLLINGILNYARNLLEIEQTARENITRKYRD